MNNILKITFSLIFALFSLNKIVYSQDSIKQPEIIITGYCSVNDFMANSSTSEWYIPGYSAYEPDKTVMEGISSFFDKNLTFTVVLGTWCGDSKEQVPRFFKILDEAGFIANDMNIICVDRKKKADGIDVEQYRIEKVPTFIIYLDENEIGRIIESPLNTLEKDLYNIFNNN
jgi:thiol-disulfide isomerase/thioredoxin